MTGNRIRDSKRNPFFQVKVKDGKYSTDCLLYTSDAADE